MTAVSVRFGVARAATSSLSPPIAALRYHHDELLREIDAALQLIRTQLVPREEFERARQHRIERIRRAGLTIEARAAQLADYARFHDRAVDLSDEVLARARAATPQSALQFAQRMLGPERRLVAILRQAYREERRGVLTRGLTPTTARAALRASSPLAGEIR